MPKKLIDCYYYGARLRFHAMLKLYNPKNIKQCVYGIEISQNGIYPTQCCMSVEEADLFDIGRYINSHQERIPKAILNDFVAKAAKFRSASSFTNFDEYFNYVADEVEARGVLVNGKCLLVYDYCLRTGYSIGLVPKDYVYLFRGAREGAIAVLGKVGVSGNFASTIFGK